ncbi:MAG: glycosyltransferase family 4 protein [Polyangiales bacterium]
MRVVLVHGEYQERGGEDVVRETERRALESAGVEIVELVRKNAEIAGYGPLQKLSLPLRTVWAWDTQRALAALLARTRPDLAHFTNTLPLISPAAYHTCQAAGVAVVQSLHNYRLACPAATFLRDGEICEECPTHGLQRAVVHACYRGSRPASATIAGMLAVHRALGTYARKVDTFVAPSAFARAKLIDTAHLPPERVVVKPNFLVDDPGADSEGARAGALFVGRLVDYKGVHTLLDAAGRLPASARVTVIGGGPLEAYVRTRAAQLPNLTVRGALPRDETLRALRRAKVLVFPSICYEVLPTVILEAFACRVPVLASRLGAMPELVRDGQTGLTFRAGDARELSEKLLYMLAHEPEREALGRGARAAFEADHDFASGRAALLRTYEHTLRRRAAI